ncbi:hypothetical protein TREMEDRAFT_58302 [Tremella mesenterica DSM 1558]|uniref:uncharacterized protein n=1 Tax=Tremella mesenterica (strain ATCC 24925 / CBS 8224 / DSM 1558 / NBRC 9311 / NRRL Y-6157 / RJB 2259-6 / UBC 559-6) TaxID=578456 RepID=UPI0003F490EE|nr:uncharacterized protein TREMEDRAFT_58302 [Tremella mesenterica DSM 1558]EIW72146.1 hypothetical protein TREMEDRAFT_58302 [Tremella mesenterica DSM 1558]
MTDSNKPMKVYSQPRPLSHTIQHGSRPQVTTRHTHIGHIHYTPHPQHREYIPTTVELVPGYSDEGIQEIEQFERAQSSTPSSHSHPNTHTHFGIPSQAQSSSHPPESSYSHHKTKQSNQDKQTKSSSEQSFSTDERQQTLHQSSNSSSDEEEDGNARENEEREETEEDEWAAARDGSILRRKPWRRPKPTWILPFLVGAALSVGMGIAPRSEIFIDLACLAHPPQQAQQPVSNLFFSLDSPLAPSAHENLPSFHMTHDVIIPGYLRIFETTSDVSQKIRSETSSLERPVNAEDSDSTSFLRNGSIKTDESDNLSPADKWFLKIQHDMWEYHLHHPSPPPEISVPKTTKTVKPIRPTEPLPYPGPSPSGQPPEQSSGEKEREGTGDTGRRNQGPPYRAIDPKLCKADPKVQAAAAKLTMILTLSMGTLSALTCGFWGQTSDRIGRTKVMAISTCGLLFNELTFIIVASFPHLAPGGYRALLLGPIVDGLLGGFSTLQATLHAYTSDVTADGSRAAVFARLAGAMMTGFAIGPVLGTYIIELTGNLMSPFYIIASVHALWVPLYLFLLPESLSSDARNVLKKNASIAKEQAIQRDEQEREWEDETPAIASESDPFLIPSNDSDGRRLSFANSGHSKRRKRLVGSTKRLLRKATGFVEPLSIFLPRKVEGRRGRDWNLTLMGGTMFLMSMMYGVLQVKTQYALFTYGWTSAELGPFMSLVGFSRGFVLLVGIPIEKPPIPHSAILDLYTLRISLLISIIFFILLSLGPSPSVYILLSFLITFGAGDTPAANSLALALIPHSSQAGRLFGALSVLHALGTTLLSPLLFGTLFALTVGKWTAAVFALSAGILGVAFGLVMLVRLRWEEEEVERGRSRTVKKVLSARRR